LTIVPEIGSVTPNSGEISASVGRIVSRNLAYPVVTHTY
jgi:hypothetical protein